MNSLPDLLISEWHPTRNGELLPKQVTVGSPRKVWWLGKDCGHEWDARIADRAAKESKCPYCSRRKVLAGFNDLATTHPVLAKELHKTKNTITATNIMAGSIKKVWWQCELGHEWEAAIGHRSKGIKCPYCAGRKLKIGDTDLATKYPDFAAQWHPTRNGRLRPEQVLAGSAKRIWWQCENKHEWSAKISDRRFYSSGCSKCSTKVSAPEKLLLTFLEDLKLKVIPSDKATLLSHELDLYIPSKNIAIEFNGLYWHSEKMGKTKNYHYNKWLECKNKSIELIQIWEDDWERNPEQIKRMLARKLGVSSEPKIFAHKTVIKSLTTIHAQSFLIENHIQGFANGSYYLGLFDKRDIEKLVAVLILEEEVGTEGKTLNVIRYATNVSVMGGFTKLLKYAEITYQPERFVSLSDNCVSNGDLYRNNGFILDKEFAPDYMYSTREGRKHKFEYSLKRFKEDPNLEYIEGLTEAQLAEYNKLYRIWDAGKQRWVKNH